jgi:hypothetical protein
MDLKLVISELNHLVGSGAVESYAIGGAVGAQRYIPTPSTVDVDVFIAFKGDSGASLTPLEPIYKFLTPRGAVVNGEFIEIGGWPVQFLPASINALYEEAVAEATQAEVAGEQVRIFTAEHLAAIALQTGRLKDKMRLADLVKKHILDEAKFLSIVNRHALESKWLAFTTGFLKEHG